MDKGYIYYNYWNYKKNSNYYLIYKYRFQILSLITLHFYIKIFFELKIKNIMISYQEILKEFIKNQYPIISSGIRQCGNFLIILLYF